MPSSGATQFTPIESFTFREVEVWRLTARGLYLKEIASELGVCKATVAEYRKTLYSKLGVDNAVRVALAAVAYGIIDIPIPAMRIAFKAKRNVGCAAR